MTSDFASQESPPRRDDIPRSEGLDKRIAGHTVIEKLLADREGLPSRSFLGRVFGTDPLSPDNYPW